MKHSWSCDTFVACRDATHDGRQLFGKNSDRPAGEAQPLRVQPARDRAGTLDLAYVSIPEAPSYAHVGAAPFWCWGYEFGINECDVVIGNEAQFTRAWAEGVAAARTGDQPDEGIVGMELVRLGLERGGTAREALDVMTTLLERHGQWTSGHFGTLPVDGAYDNSYLIADRDDAWVLETSGREWIARRVEEGVCSISNEPSIRAEYDLRSDGLVDAAVERGWLSVGTPFDYAASHADPQTPLQVSHMRQRRSEQLLVDARARGGVNVDAAKAVLRDHYEDTFLGGPSLNAAYPDFLTLCMHEHPSGFTWGNTAGSVVVELARDAEDLTVVWWTPVTPCTGAYIPIFPAAGRVPGALLLPASPTRVERPERIGQTRFDADSYWWRFQNLLDAAKGDGSDFTSRQSEIRSRFDVREQDWASRADELREAWRTAGPDERDRLTDALAELTEAAVREADNEVDALLRTFAPDSATRAVDPRWA